MAIDHKPVLAPELVELLAPELGQTAVDCTFGGGGHARLVAERIGWKGTLICIDRDPAAEARFEAFAAEVPCATRFVGADFAAGLRALRGEGIHPDMVYMDLGMSSMQVDAWQRGFSYSYDAPLDMRMDPRQELSAADVVNEWPEARLAQLLRRFGEERYAGGIARQIARRRPLATTSELVEAIKAGMPPSARFGGGHPAKRTFQAIRIAVNGELESLDDALPTAWSMLPVAGRLAAISFHSLEDRRVKRFLAGARSRLRLPARAAGLRLRTRARSRASDPPRRRARPGRGRAQPALEIRPPARRAEDRRDAGGGGLMAAAATASARRVRTSSPIRRTKSNSVPMRTAPRRAPLRRSGAQLIPIAVGTATAVRQLPDSSLIVRMTRGRAWIAVLGVLLVGIVALNVVTLSVSATQGHVERNIQALDQENPFLRGREAQVSSAVRVRHDAAALGLTAATAEGPASVDATPRDAAIAAQRLAAAAGGY